MLKFLALIKLLGPLVKEALPILLEILALFSGKTAEGLKAASTAGTSSEACDCIAECAKHGGDVTTCQACCDVIAEAE